MYRIIIKRDGNNPLTGKARYRVTYCWPKCSDSILSNKTISKFINNHWLLNLDKPRRIGTIINPRKALNI